MGRRNQAESYLNVHAFDVWSSDMAYALGLFYADGCLTQSSAGSSWRVMLHNTDLDTVEWWHRFLNNKTKIAVHPASLKRPLPLYTATASSDLLGKRLCELGVVPKKSWADFTLPVMSPDHTVDFIRGLFDGDGSICLASSKKSKGHKRIKVNITSNSMTFREDLCRLFKSQGWHPNNDRIAVTLTGSDAEHFCQWIYGSGGRHMIRKKKVWENWIEFRNPYGGLICDSDPYESLRGLRPQTWHAEVGRLSDKEVAKIAGVSSGQVFNVRKALGLPPVSQTSSNLERPWHCFVGTMSDREVATQNGIPPFTVCAYRNKHGIPVYRQTEVVNG